jgi:hypothetical protein
MAEPKETAGKTTPTQGAPAADPASGEKPAAPAEVKPVWRFFGWFRKTPPDLTEYPALEEKVYFSERDHFRKGASRSQRMVDKLVVSGSAGALILSTTFLHDIAPRPLKSTQPVLAFGWLALLVALAASVASHITAGRTSNFYIDHLDEDYEAKRFTRIPTSTAERMTHVLNAASVLLMAAGIAALVVFAYLNINFVEGPAHGTEAQQTPYDYSIHTAGTQAPDRHSDPRSGNGRHCSEKDRSARNQAGH